MINLKLCFVLYNIIKQRKKHFSCLLMCTQLSFLVIFSCFLLYLFTIHYNTCCKFLTADFLWAWVSCNWVHLLIYDICWSFSYVSTRSAYSCRHGNLNARDVCHLPHARVSMYAYPSCHLMIFWKECKRRAFDGI